MAIPACGATRTWLGATSLWSNPNNWTPNGVPQNGDSLTFPDVSPFGATSMVNDLASLTVNTMTFTAGPYALNGNALTFIQGITDNHSGGLNVVRCDIQFTSGGGRFNSLDAGQLELSGTTTLAGNQDLIITALASNITVSGVIQGTGGLIKRGEGALFLRGNANNTYTGATRVEGGDMHLAKTSAARAISSTVIIERLTPGALSLSDDLPGQYPPALSMLITNGGSWRITNGATVTSLFLDDGFLEGSGLLNLECDVTAQGLCQARCSLNLGSQSRRFVIDLAGGAEQLDVFGTILGPLGPNTSGIIKEGQGLLILKNQNTYLGATLIKDGELTVQHGGALGSSGAGAETKLQGGVLRFDGALTCPEPIMVESYSAVRFSGTNTLTGPLTLGNTCTFWGDFNSDFLEIRSTIDGPGGLPDFWGPGGLQVWIGTVRLSGTAPNKFGGGTLVSGAGLGWRGVLELAKPDNVVATPGLVFIRGYGAPAGDAILRQLQDGGVTNVLIGHGGSWQFNGHTATPTALAFTGDGYVDTQGGLLQLINPGTNQLRVLPDSIFPSGYLAGISGRLSCDALTNIFVVESNLTLNVAARVSGAANIVKQGLGTMRLSNSNSFTGSITVNEGQLTTAHAYALGTTAAGTFLNNNASLALDGGFSGIEIADETLTLDSTNAAALASIYAVTNVWNGSIVLQRTAGISVPDPLGALTHSGLGLLGSSVNISGPGGFTKSGPGALFITGLIGGNSYTGPTTITDGLLEATRPGRSLSGNILITGANAVLRTGRPGNIFNSVPTVLPVGASVTVQSNALWTMTPTNSENISRLVGDGRLDIASAGALTVSNSVSCTFSGAVSGSGALNKRGLATLQFTGQSPSYTGPATVFDGSYNVDGYFASSPVTVKLSSILRGSGAVGDVTVENGGAVRVDPSNPGVLGGAMQFNSATFHAGGVLAAQFFGPDPTAGNDFLYVLNSVTLSNSAHSFGFSYPPHEGDVITVIQKIAAGAISGAFSGFPEGAVINISQIPVVTSYVGGNGNDMTLTVTNLPLGGGGSQLVGGTGSSVLTPNDCSLLSLIVTNRGGVTISNLHGTLRSLTAGVVVTISESSFPNLAVNARGTNATPFQIRTTPEFPCGGGVQLELVLTGSNIPPIAILYTLPGASGFHLDFDGINDEVEVAANTFSGVVNNFTIELWANPTGNRTQTAETNAGISGVSVPLHQNQRFAVFPDQGNIAYGVSHVGAGLSIGRNGISAYEQGTNHLPSRLVYSNAVSGWTHVALVYGSRAPKLYVNGALVRSGSSSIFPNVHPSASLGGSTQGSFGNFKGQLRGKLRVLFTASFISLAAAQPDGVARLDTVVVSATNATPQDMAESLPLAETVVTGRELDLSGVISVVDLYRAVPNFSQSQAGARSYANTYALRGIANTDFLSDPAVVLYVDDVPFDDVVSYTTDLLAVDRVEVFRGPQGSRFGKNSEAGVINVVTRQPTDVFEAAANVSYATFDTQRYQAYAAGPVAKGKLRFSLAGQDATSDGFIRNGYLGDHADEQEGINGRASLNWIPSDNWAVDVTATEDDFNDGIGLVSLNGDPRETMSDFNGTYDQSANSLAMRARGQLDSVALTSITAWRQFHLDPFKIDPDFSPATGNVGVNTWDETQWSEELRLRPLSPPENWDWHAGFFFSTNGQRHRADSGFRPAATRFLRTGFGGSEAAFRHLRAVRRSHAHDPGQVRYHPGIAVGLHGPRMARRARVHFWHAAAAERRKGFPSRVAQIDARLSHNRRRAALRQHEPWFQTRWVLGLHQ